MRRRGLSGKASSKLVCSECCVPSHVIDDISAEAFKPVHQNDAERILFALESIRKTPLTDARKSSSFNNNPLPPELIGSSSRQLRKAISVPLATAQAGENAKNQRHRERLGENHVSVMISPYGRRREMDQATNDARRNKQRQDGGSGQSLRTTVEHGLTKFRLSTYPKSITT